MLAATCGTKLDHGILAVGYGTESATSGFNAEYKNPSTRTSALPFGTSEARTRSVLSGARGRERDVEEDTRNQLKWK